MQHFLILSLLLLTTAAPGGQSLPLAAAPNTADHGVTWDIGPETTKKMMVKQNLSDLNELLKNIEIIRTSIVSRAHFSPNEQHKHQLVKQALMKNDLMRSASALMQDRSRVEPFAGEKDPSVVFVTVFCSLMGVVLAVLLLVLGFVVWKEAYEVSERKRRKKHRDLLPISEDFAYTAYPRDDSPSNFPSVYPQTPEENDTSQRDVHPGPAHRPRQIAAVHNPDEYMRSRSILRVDRQHPKKVVRLQVPPDKTAPPTVDKRYTQYDVTGTELSDKQKWYRSEVSRRTYRY